MGASLPSSYRVTLAFLGGDGRQNAIRSARRRQRSIGSARRRAEAMPDGRRQSRRVRSGRVTPMRSISRWRAASRAGKDKGRGRRASYPSRGRGAAGRSARGPRLLKPASQRTLVPLLGKGNGCLSLRWPGGWGQRNTASSTRQTAPRRANRERWRGIRSATAVRPSRAPRRGAGGGRSARGAASVATC